MNQNKSFYLIVWKQFNDKRLIDKSEIVNIEDAEDGLQKIKGLNAEKRLTTTDYRVVNLTELLRANGLTINEFVEK